MSPKDLSDLAVMLGLVVGCAFLLSVVGALVRIIWMSVCEDDR
jgi:hypothetical protein